MTEKKEKATVEQPSFKDLLRSSRKVSANIAAAQDKARVSKQQKRAPEQEATQTQDTPTEFDPNTLTVAQLQEIFTASEVEFTKNAKKDELVKLYLDTFGAVAPAE